MVLLITDGLQVPVIPFVEVVGNAGAVLPVQSVFVIENVGVTLGVTVKLIVSVIVVPQEFVAVNDSFGESGTPDQLMKKYGLETEDIIHAVHKVIKRKRV